MKPARVAAIACALFLFACGGGGGGGGGSSAPDPAVVALQGAWNGTIEDLGTLDTVRIVIGASGNITQVLIGGVDIGVTGSISKTATNLFSFSTTDGTVGGFFADATGTYAAFVTDDPLVGVVQKTASALPTYVIGDVANANWSGYNVDLNANLSVAATSTSTALINNDGTRTFSGNTSAGGGGAFTGSLPTADLAFGRWIGTFSQAGAGITNGTVHAFLSIDKKFAGTWSCPTSTLSVSNCIFIAWSHP